MEAPACWTEARQFCPFTVVVARLETLVLRQEPKRQVLWIELVCVKSPGIGACGKQEMSLRSDVSK